MGLTPLPDEEVPIPEEEVPLSKEEMIALGVARKKAKRKAATRERRKAIKAQLTATSAANSANV